MPWGVVAGAVIGGVVNSVASRNAARAQENAAERSSDTQLQMFSQNREDMAPWRQAGVNALGYLTPGLAPGGEFNRDFTMEDFQKDPGYDFRMREGEKALSRSAGAKGLLGSGAFAKGLARYGQDYASNEYTNAFNRYQQQLTGRYNRLAGVSGTGQTATNQLADQGTRVAANVGQSMLAGGNARASGYMGVGNAITGAISSGMGAYQNQQYLNAFGRT